MSIIEGIGDEVTVVVTFTTVVFVAMATYLYRNLRFEDTLNVPQFWQSYVTTRRRPQTVAGNPPNANDRPVEQTIPEPDSSTVTNESNKTRAETTSISDSEVSSSSSTDIPREIVLEENENETVVDSSNEDGVNEQASIDEATHNSNANNQTEAIPTNLSNGNTEPVPSNEIQVRLKYLNDTEKIVTTQLTETVGTFKRVHFASDLNENKVVRLIFNGQLLRDNMTLQNYRIEHRTVLHVHVSQAQPQPNYSTTGIQSDLDISSYMWPLFSIILALCWIMYIRYPEFFSVTSIILLVAFSASFFVVYIHSQVQVP